MSQAKHPAFVAGFGCVHPNTKVHTEFGLMRICEIDRPMRVLSWNDKTGQFQLSLSGGAFPKGKANLYRVVTQQGEFVATEHHRSFCADGMYRAVGALGVQDRLATFCGDLLATSLELARQSLRSNDPHCLKTIVNSMGSYADAARQYGQRLLGAVSNGQSCVPSQGGAQELFQPAFPALGAHMGGLSGMKQSHTHRDQSFDRHDIDDWIFRQQPPAFFVEDCISASQIEHTSRFRLACLQFLRMFGYRHTKEQSFVRGRVQNLSSACQNPLVLSNSSILRVLGEERNSPYWDMQVLDTNNYVDEFGHIHHNSGKSEVMAVSAFGDAAHSSTALIGLYAPTYDLVRLITAPRMVEKLSEFGIPHKWNKADSIIYTSWPRFGDFIMRTMENPERIVGYETYRAHVDELDTLKPDAARKAWNQIIARNRQKPKGIPDPFNRVSAYTTPEGFRFVYDRWVRNAGPAYEIIQAPTYSNPFLPADYVDNLRSSYPAELIDAYIEGRFVNLAAGTVYRNYSRIAHRSGETIRDKEPLHIGQDFNVGEMASAVLVERDGNFHAVAELCKVLDTPDLITLIKEKYPDRRIYVYPDASGGSRKTVNASTSDIALLRQAGFVVRCKDTNPAVKDRVLSVNTALSKGRLLINDALCPRTAEALEQQAYDKNGEPDKTSGHDHANDALGYAVHWLCPVIKPRFETRTLRL